VRATSPTRSLEWRKSTEEKNLHQKMEDDDRAIEWNVGRLGVSQTNELSPQLVP
jgi:hypothetical protein